MDISNPRLTRVPLFTPGGKYVGVVINGRWLECPPCRENRCPVTGPHQHTFDLTTGFEASERSDADDPPVLLPVMHKERA